MNEENKEASHGPLRVTGGFESGTVNKMYLEFWSPVQNVISLFISSAGSGPRSTGQKCTNNHSLTLDS